MVATERERDRLVALLKMAFSAGLTEAYDKAVFRIARKLARISAELDQYYWDFQG